MIDVQTFNTLGEATQAVSSGGRYYGGGTLVMRAINYCAEDGLDRVVRVSDPSLKEIRMEGNRLLLGAGVTMSELIRNRDTEFLSNVARAVGGPAIRSAATIGGNLFAPHPYGDFATALLALDAQVVTADGSQQALDVFLTSRDHFSGIVRSVSLVVPDRGAFRFKKVSRVKPKGVSVMSIAAHLPQSAGRISNAKIAFGAMGPTPVLANGAARVLEGASLDQATADRAGAELKNDLRPHDDPIATAWYRSEVAPIHLKRLLLEGGQ